MSYIANGDNDLEWVSMTYFKSTRSFKSCQLKSWSRSSLSQKSFQAIVNSSHGSAKSSQVMTYDLNDLTSWVSFSHRIVNTVIFNGYPHQKAWYRMYLGTLLYTVSQLPKPRIFHLQWAIVRNVEKSYFLLLIWKGLYVYQLKNLMKLHNEVQHLVVIVAALWYGR